MDSEGGFAKISLYSFQSERHDSSATNAIFQPNYSEALAQETFPVIHPTQSQNSETTITATVESQQ